jgi:hypothetical protein
MRNPGHPIYNQNGHPNGNGNGGYYNNDSPMSAHSQQHSYETMTSGSDENGKSTNPSSLNSSYDHLHQARKPDHYTLQNQYNEDIHFTPVPPQQLYSNYAPTNGNAYQANGNTDVRDYDPYSHGGVSNGTHAPPRPPVKDYTPAPANNPRQPIRLNATTTEGAPPMQPKRQSWIKRTFSRRGH